MKRMLSLGLTGMGVLLAAAAPSVAMKGKKLKFGPKAELVFTERNVTETLTGSTPAPFDPAKTKTRSRKSRGNVELFAKVAPAIVLVRTEGAHGTGFFISNDGFLLTNHHVVADGMTYDPARRASVAQIHVGKLAPDGTMTLMEAPSPALFYKADPGKDLALLKLANLPGEVGAFAPSIPLAPQGPRPAQSCSIVGHPGFGMMWSYRGCAISAIGRDSDIVKSLMIRLATAGGAGRDDVESAAKSLPSRRTVVSSCGASPGDSGGPLLDEQGNLIAVTFAIPPEGQFDKFTYHVHLDEVRAFLAERPGRPTVLTPDPWALGPRVELADLLDEGRPQTLIGGEQRPAQLLFDLDGNTDLETPLANLVARRSFEAEAAVHLGDDETPPRAFYDNDNDGFFDLIVEAGGVRRRMAEKIYRLGADKTWEMVDARQEKQPWLGHQLPGTAGAKLARLLAKLGAD